MKNIRPHGAMRSEITETKDNISKPEMKIQFEAVAEDFADVYCRSLEHENPASQSVFDYLFKVLFSSAAVSVPAFVFNPNRIWLGAISFALALTVSLWLFPFPGKRYYRKSYYAAWQQMFGNLNSVTVGVELLERGLKISQLGNEYIFAWENITGIEETDDAIYFYYKGGGTAVRKRAFQFPDEYGRFISSAKSHVQSIETKR